ncbi:type 1 glutamine amidotransferase domain-containing protein [Litorilituus sediminis]|uniref:Type 1 glutamine amidotransferase domain-containing protein n=2 Tax=Litorilituus sediminis TaxID=718192 RepID=A0A4V0ZGL7_9GAMM|nr:type 1 glutamine amidotransferase domain-containing protein [Litorilituus sediminis]
MSTQVHAVGKEGSTDTQGSADKQSSADKQVLMVVTSYGKGNERPGYEFDEFAKAYSVFKANGITVDVASPRGGKVQADEYDKTKPFNVPVLADKAIMAKLENTLPTASLDAASYDGIFIVGGKGAMFDLPKDKALQAVIADIYQQQGSVAAVCHGPAALVDVKLADGSYLIAGKAVNGFTNKEEVLFGKKWLKQFEFMLEDKLKERGGKFQSSNIMLSHVAVDGRLVTGQNPSSTTGVAVALVKSLGLTPVATEQYLDDKTMAVIAQLLAGDKTAEQTLTTQQDQYHIPLVGMYGFYFLKVAEQPREFEQALTLMLIAQEAINNPMFDMQIAKTQHKLGKNQAAKTTLEHVLEAKPDYKPALDMLKTL